MYQIKAKILFNEKIISGHYKMRLYAPEIAQEAKPGQFVHIKIRDGYDPLLRRPFSIHRCEGEKIEILYKVVGRGTEFLSRKKIGNEIDTLGPLGQGFKISPDLRRIVLVAGGMGIAPLYFLAEKLNREDILILLGAESKGKILYLENLKNLNVKVQIATEDGSQGYKGLLSEFFFHLLKEDSQIDLVCACGPIPMVKKIAQLSLKYKIPCQVSLEQRMGCGIGVCLGCTIKGESSYLRVCSDGPVFQANQIRWKEER